MGFGFSGRGSGGDGHRDQGMISELRAYWEALRNGDMLPRRDQVDPRGIANALEHAFLVERIAPGLARFRIAGMACNDLMGMDIRGMPLSSLFLGEARMRLQMEMERLFRGPMILNLSLEAERSLGRPGLTARMIVLPMVGHLGDCDLAVGCIELTGELGRTPRRFSITDSALERIETPQTNAPAAHPKKRAPDPMPQARPLTAFAEPAAPFAPAPPPRPTPGVPHLRLVKG